ncbi:Glycoside hydrolase family 2 immunoglobulin-like beta-sandwich [Pleurostoma richardsiae]|uniref:Glycoside hydrolase family 2 immunoglobulin-like beta-sandwich n=1 Tax=Pleurostoma richardsiae TaxID=41990 RepID=A0AA38S6V5_9PEZI|nr:Glycoside hydrolase family 2 immunoglobulin-like beta-sandwich [Pleurostoma richardsiae]
MGRLSASSLLVLAQLVAAGCTRNATSTSTVVPTSPATPVPYQLKPPLLNTPWTDDVGTNPWPQHPRPQLRRDEWKSLNGIWTYQAAGGDSDVDNLPPAPLGQEVLIPSCIESGISGIMERNVTHMWFATSFSVPNGWSEDHVLLHFEAVDYEATVFINGVHAGFNRGGYFRFTIDATEYLDFDGTNSLLVFVHDPTDIGGAVIPIGKQTSVPTHIFYTPCSGIWQTVWLESAPATYVSQLDVAADADGKVTVNVHSSTGEATAVEISVIDQDGSVIATKEGTSDEEFDFTVESADLWSPNSPTLYNLTVKLGDDSVSSYTGFRSITVGEVDGTKRPLLNGEFVFQFGTLDQGFWPDGIYLAPTYEALVFDLHLLKKLGMNMVRKHIKVEPDLFYRACDEIGLLVIQDMPSFSPNFAVTNPNTQISADDEAEFERQLSVLIEEHKSYTCIVTWVIYNEGWGQITSPYYPEFAIADRIKEQDPTRLIDATTGWNDHGAGDFSDNHHYANAQCGTPFYSTASSPYDPNRVGLQGEFGGIGHNVSIEHLWPVQYAIDHINQTYEIDADLDVYNYRAHFLLDELRQQTEMFACSGAVYTQTTDVEGEVNGLVTYDRRLQRVDENQWKADIQALYDAAAGRGGAGNSTQNTKGA